MWGLCKLLGGAGSVAGFVHLRAFLFLLTFSLFFLISSFVFWRSNVDLGFLLGLLDDQNDG